jgi:SAM-dependent methyltransferase
MNSEKTLRAVENGLADLPGVRRAAVVIRESTAAVPGLVAYVVPDDGFVERTFSDQNDEARRTEKWRKIYDLYQNPKVAESIESGLRARVWHSTYTKQPIPGHEMQEWIGHTLDRVKQLHPARILEIGCGLGSLLLPLGPGCKRYVGTDISGASIAALKSHIAASPEKWRTIELFERPADDFDDFDDGSFDTVIINSVAMYFPSVEYLTKVMKGAIRMACPEGAIFVGDVRSLPLLPTFAVSVEIFQAPSGLSLDELRLRVHKRLKLEKELLISPSYFLALQKVSPEISHVEIRPKRGICDNELNRFRYDAVLHLGCSTKNHIEPSWLHWSDNELTFELIDQKLRHQRPEILAITGIRNQRLEEDNLALKILTGADQFQTVTELKEAINKMAVRGVHPERLLSLADELGYQMDFSWASCESDGSYDVVFYGVDSGVQRFRAAFNWPRPSSVSCNMAHHVADPVRIDHRRKLVGYLRDLMQQELGESLLPVDFVMLDVMPITNSGSINRSALPLPWLSGL